MKLRVLADMIGGRLTGDGEVEVGGFSTDSRDIPKGGLFVAKVGANTDGHNYIASAEKNGAVALLVHQEVDSSLPQIHVKDTLLAFGDMARAWRRQFDIPVIALTGSVGKTTTRGMIASILATKGKVLSTQGNLNTEVGVPITLLRLQAEHQYAVIEMGAGKPGDIDCLTRIAEPTAAMVTCIAPAHYEGFGSLDAIYETKTAIYNGLVEKGCVFVNLDDDFAPKILEKVRGRKTVTFGMETWADVAAHEARLRDNGCYDFKVMTPKGENTVSLRVPGIHMVQNALAAAAVAHAHNFTPAQIKQGLECYQPEPGRMRVKTGIQETTVIDDTYNANIKSVAAGLLALADAPGDKCFVFGQMGELGEVAKEHHERVGMLAKQLGVRSLFGFGELAKWTVEAFGQNGKYFEEKTDLIAALKAQLRAGMTVLVKGSRFTKMEEVVQAITVEEA